MGILTKKIVKLKETEHRIPTLYKFLNCAYIIAKPLIYILRV
jgi:hypothetical protein